MQYISTRGGSTLKTFAQILLEGTASDGGLYVPEEYPRMRLSEFRGAQTTYLDVARYVMSSFGPDIPPDAWEKLLNKTYTEAIFGTSEIVPLKKLEQDLWLMRLSNGPTLAFKDLAMQLLGNLMEYVLEQSGAWLNVLGATSGDTGSAAAYALRGKKRIRLFMLVPRGRTSEFQRRQMYTLNERNIHIIEIDGTFDDCQDLVKLAFDDADFKQQYRLGAVNSINWARIAAQVIYYIDAYLHVHKRGTEVDFCVPSGNFGNALAAHVAREMGLPIRRIVVATNANDVLYEFFAKGIYRVRKKDEVATTSSPSMDIAKASNFERFVFDMVDRDADLVNDWWAELAETGSFDGSCILPRTVYSWGAGSASDTEVLATIGDVYKKYGEIIDPHTAVGVHVGLQYRKPNVPLIVAETAQPAKFADTIHQAIGTWPPVPKAYKDLALLPERQVRLAGTVGAIKKYIRDKVR